MSIVIAIPTEDGYQTFDTWNDEIRYCTECGRIIADDAGHFSGSLSELIAECHESKDTVTVIHNLDEMPDREFDDFVEYSPEETPICDECGRAMEDGARASINMDQWEPSLTAAERNIGSII